MLLWEIKDVKVQRKLKKTMSSPWKKAQKSSLTEVGFFRQKINTYFVTSRTFKNINESDLIVFLKT